MPLLANGAISPNSKGGRFGTLRESLLYAPRTSQTENQLADCRHLASAVQTLYIHFLLAVITSCDKPRPIAHSTHSGRCTDMIIASVQTQHNLSHQGYRWKVTDLVRGACCWLPLGAPPDWADQRGVHPLLRLNCGWPCTTLRRCRCDLNSFEYFLCPIK